MTFMADDLGKSDKTATLGGIALAPRHGVAIEILIGRSLAFCAHPWAAWRRLGPRGRLLLVAAYFGASYTSVLAVLLLA